MSALTLAFVTLTFAAQMPPAGPTDTDVRQSVQRGLGFLEQKGILWQEKQTCSGCHHVPMLLWSHHEARAKGFPLNPKVLDTVEAKAMAPYLSNPKVQPKADGTYVEQAKYPGPEMVYLLAAAGNDLTVANEVLPGLERFLTALLESQEADGSWTLKNWGAPTKAPIYETNEVYTLWVLLALRTAEKTHLSKEMLAKGRERALLWLEKNPVGESVQALALRLVVQMQNGKREADPPLVKKLLGLQHADGGWSYATGSDSDALATGQALYALATAGFNAENREVQQGRAYLLKTQQADGSWKLSNGNRTFFGTGWATLGLIRTLPVPAAKGRSEAQSVSKP